MNRRTVKSLVARTPAFAAIGVLVAVAGCRKEKKDGSVPAAPPVTPTAPAAEPDLSGRTRPKNKETLESVIRKLSEKWANTKSMTADMTIRSAYSNPTGDFLTIGTARFEFQRQGNKTLFRKYTKYTITISRDGQEKRRYVYSDLEVNDGEFYYLLHDRPDAVTAEKYPDASDTSLDGRSLYERMSKSDDQTFVGLDKVNGRDVYVIRSKPKGQSYRKETLAHYDVETGELVKSTFHDWVGKRESSMAMDNIKINPSIDPARFRFEVPEGVELVDRTGK